MPKSLERNLRREVFNKFGTTTSEEAREYIYGTLRKTGWKPGQGGRSHGTKHGKKR